MCVYMVVKSRLHHSLDVSDGIVILMINLFDKILYVYNIFYLYINISIYL